jgi:ABC-type dipeptide/oligopeptide/nickel transport system ATPase component
MPSIQRRRVSDLAGAPVAASAVPLLSVRDLVTEFLTSDGPLRAVDGVSFDVHPGEIVGLVGESGSGKSATAFSILGLLPKRTARVASGQILFDGRDLGTMSSRELRAVRGRAIAMVFQDPASYLNPLMRIGRQVSEALEAHDPGLSRADLRRRALELLELVGIPNARGRLDQYPHEFSGGMRQRVIIAIAIANKPRVLIADEPTTALDVTVQAC